MIHKTVFQHISIQNLTVEDFGDYKNIPRPLPPLVCKLMQLTEAFLTTNHCEDRSWEGRKDRKLEAEALWSVGGGGGGEERGHFSMDHCPINPFLLDRLEHVNSI